MRSDEKEAKFTFSNIERNEGYTSSNFSKLTTKILWIEKGFSEYTKTLIPSSPTSINIFSESEMSFINDISNIVFK